MTFKKYFIIMMISALGLMSLLVLGIALWQPKAHVDQTARLLVVFGAGYSQEGIPVLALEKRLDKSLELWHQDFYIMVSGRKEEVHVMEEYLRKRNIPESYIITDINGEHTRATVQNAFKRARQIHTSPIFISQAYHLPRIRLYALFYGRGEGSYIATDRVMISLKKLLSVSFREVIAILVFPYLYVQEFFE
ncbi:MAG: ElyC/SanA/YdcF family protein [Brevinema sp.]